MNSLNDRQEGKDDGHHEDEDRGQEALGESAALRKIDAVEMQKNAAISFFGVFSHNHSK